MTESEKRNIRLHNQVKEGVESMISLEATLMRQWPTSSNVDPPDGNS